MRQEVVKKRLNGRIVRKEQVRKENKSERKEVNGLPIILKTSFPLHCGCSSMNCSMAMSFKGMPFNRSNRSMPRSNRQDIIARNSIEQIIMKSESWLKAKDHTGGSEE